MTIPTVRALGVAPAPERSPRPQRPARQREIDKHPVTFSGSGSEYFRVWIVNVLLTIVTLGIYTPRARRRTAQYFYSHTQVVGSPLEFVASARKMLMGFLAFAGLYGAFKLAQNTGQDLAASIMFFGFAALAPYLWASAMRFRLGATRWRGIRLAFTANWKEVYTASWPVFVIAAIWAATFAALNALLPKLSEALGSETEEEMEVRMATAMADPAMTTNDWMAIGVGLVAAVLTLLCVIRLEYNYKRLLFARARIGSQAGRWKPVYGDFVKVWLATAGLLVVCLVLGWVLMTGLLFGGVGLLKNTATDPSVGAIVLMTILSILAFVVGITVISVPARAYREARMFQLVWNNAGFGGMTRTKTRLRTGSYVGLRIKNVLLSFLTLGFYRPFAVASEYAAKANSVTFYVRGGADQLEGELVQQQGAFGDAAADAMGLDLIG
ncbi:YjgN family protein [Ottowia sp.]|uniref:YjgN family protein n=1 Tax=Ottowia sp. TaxID=1898956 RepID=UPI003A88C5C4